MSESQATLKKILDWINPLNHWSKLSSGWKGAAMGLSIVTLILYFIQGYHMIGDRGLLDYFIGVAVFFIAVLLICGILTCLIHWLKKVPSLYLWIALTSFVLVFISFLGPLQLMFLVSIFIVLSFSILGTMVSRIRNGQHREGTKSTRIMTIGLSLLSCGGILLGSYWLFQNGAKGLPKGLQQIATMATVQDPLALENPAEPGRYPVNTLTYGSANSYREEFNQKNSLITEPVDGSAFVENWSSIRRKTFGFGPEAMPLNGTVWYPEGQGTFPLVMAVHGNHLATDYSDGGYAYLGELLASKGYIFVSIDENFLNTSPYDDLFMLKVLEKENPARGWLMLEHLKVWEQWNGTKNHPFYNKVDMNNISLIGHSRGGEAVTIAALYNQLSSSPEDGNIKFNYHFNIRSIVSIAGTDGQYKPGGEMTRLKDISYLAIQGTHDMDVSSFDTVNQYSRIEFTENSDHFKSTVYVYGANHGQFNTSWGKYDGVGFGNRLYNIGKLLPEEDQLQISKVLITSFLEATLKQKEAYREVLQDINRARAWLPETLYISDYWDGKTLMVANFDEDLDFSTATLDGVRLVGKGLKTWREEPVKLKYIDGRQRAVLLAWDRATAEELPSYTLQFSESGITPEAGTAIVFSMADGEEAASERKEGTLDLTVQVEDSGGNIARLPLSSVGTLLPMIEGDIVKWPFTSVVPTKEPVFQNFSIQLGAFQKVNPQFNAAQLSKVSFIFDKTDAGAVYLTNIGIR